MPVLMEMLGELADFLRLPQHFVNTPENLGSALFESPRGMEAVIVRYHGEVAGFASWLEKYRPFSGQSAMWVDYIYVRPAYRRFPLAVAMLIYMMGIAKARNYKYVQGAVLEWNTAARKMYGVFEARSLRTACTTSRCRKSTRPFSTAICRPIEESPRSLRHVPSRNRS